MGKTILNSNSDIRVKIYRSITEVSEGEWDAIVEKNRIFCTHKYVEALEKSGISEGRCYYPAVYDGDKIIAHACVYFISTEMDLFARGAIKKIIQLVRRLWKNFFILRLLECGPPISMGSALSFKCGVNRAETLQLVCHAIEGLAKELGVKAILFRDFYNEEMEFYDLLKERGYVKIHNLPKAEIKIRWKSFDEYLNSMRKNYKHNIIKNMDKCARANISIKALENFSSNSRELKRLYDNVCNHAKEIKREQVTESFFQNIDKYLGKKAVVLSAMKDDLLLGFTLALFSNKTLISTFIGLDYDYNREYCLYFNLFYRTIELAIETGMENIDMGITSLDPKKEMGSNVVVLNMYMRHANPILNSIIPALLDMTTPADTSGPRNVFKENPAG